MDNQGVTADPQLQQFIEVESQKQRFQQLVHQMTEVCWVSVYVCFCPTGLHNASLYEDVSDNDRRLCVVQYIMSNHFSCSQVYMIYNLDVFM